MIPTILRVVSLISRDSRAQPRTAIGRIGRRINSPRTVFLCDGNRLSHGAQSQRMRNLKLTTPRMIGSDVSDWQQFLAGQGLYEDNVDGVYGPVTSQATRDYQKSAGIAPDGVVGPSTLAKAVRDMRLSR